VTGGRAWEALPSRLRTALAAGVTVVTPNNRLARRLHALYDGAQRASGRLAWDAAVVLPWSAWLERLWQDVIAAGFADSAPRLITVAQSAFLWRRIVAAERLLLIDEGGLARLTADAWSIVHAWGAGGPSWRAWSGGDDDRDAFARWAEAYSQRVAAAGAIDFAQLPDRLAGAAPRMAQWRGAAATLAGFIDESPQQDRLIAALVAAGVTIDRCASVGDTAGTSWRVIAATPRDEVMSALQWARERVLAEPGTTIGIAIENLGSRREEIRALADDILCPALQWPGHEEAARPYNISLGTVAASVPMIAAALDWIALAHGALPMERAAALLRSPHVTAAEDDWMRRGSLEAVWLVEGRRELTLDDTIAALSGVDRPLAERWQRARASLRRPASATSREWVEFWRAWIDAGGWPGERALSSMEWQARELWDDLLATFATFGWVAQRIAAEEAAPALDALARDRIFQPESPSAPVQILGGLEAAGLSFDALWVADLAAEVWPPAPRPNPLLPLAWQRERNAPHATAARELAYAQALTAQWARGAPDVVFSFARNADEHERSVSLLMPEGMPLVLPAPVPALRQLAAAAVIETLTDDRAPPLEGDERIRGGASLIAAQSDCPFQAMARFRLGARPWPTPAVGLRPIDRGIVVHATLASLFHDIRDHATLVALSASALDARVAAAAEAALAEFPAARWRQVPQVVRAGEVFRIVSTVRAWIEAFERPRPPFSVAAVELERRLNLAGLELVMRIDREDLLADGGMAIIDYKTGLAKSPAAWFDGRAQAPQIGLYVLAERDQAPQLRVRAAAYPQLKAGEINVRGIAADPDAWPALQDPTKLLGGLLPDWAAVEAHWRRALESLALEVREGYAAVTPRDTRATCRNCGLQSLCRIGALWPEALEEADDAFGEGGG
jgi:probable DNA repair protein